MRYLFCIVTFLSTACIGQTVPPANKEFSFDILKKFPEYSDTSKYKVLVTDDFSADKNNFKLNDTKVKIANGKLMITSTAGEIELASCRTILKHDENFSISADVKHTGGVNDRGYGLKCGGADKYVDLLIGSNYFMISGTKMISEWKQTSAIHTGENATNNLLIKRLGSEITFYINNVLVYTESAVFSEYNIVGFIVLDNQTVEFDDLVVKGVRR